MHGSFLYYFPGVTATSIDRKWLRQSPLGDVLRDIWERGEGWGLLHRAEVVRGPDSGNGVVISANPPDTQPVGYYPERQVWKETQRGWIGFDKEHKPGPQSLVRRRLVTGLESELADGNVWHLPTIAQPTSPNVLPLTVRLPTVVTSESIQTKKPKIVEHYAGLWELTAKVFDWQVAGVNPYADKSETYLWAYRSACEFLGLNYRVAVEEVDILELLEDEDHAAVIAAAIDIETVEKILHARNSGVPTDPTQVPEFQSS